jgi:hypothetical protein
MTRCSTFGALALLLASCGPANPPTAQTAETPPPTSSTDAGAPAPDLPLVVLGLPLGATMAEVVAAFPGLEVQPLPDRPGSGAANLATTIEDVPATVGLSFADDRLFALSLDVAPDAASIDAYRALQTRARTDLGPGHATRCESDGGAPFEEYLLHGQGGLRTEWRDPPLLFTGEIALTKDYGGADKLRIRGYFSVPSLAPPADDFLFDGVEGVLEASKQAAECTVDLANAPPATLLGLPFGASRAQVEQMLGRTLTDLGLSLSYPGELEGVPGTFHVAFYDGCLAVLMFVSDSSPATTANYRKLLEWARGTLGPGDALRCISEDGLSDEEHIADGFGFYATVWRGNPPLDGGLRLERNWNESRASQIVFEADYLPLREYAPQIDFADQALHGSKRSLSTVDCRLSTVDSP